MELEQIKKSILEIRGKKVMLDMDLAIIYEVENKSFKTSSPQKHRSISG
jgi:hypothetical protein